MRNRRQAVAVIRLHTVVIAVVLIGGLNGCAEPSQTTAGEPASSEEIATPAPQPADAQPDDADQSATPPLKERIQALLHAYDTDRCR
jgi:hypothetical protein